MRLRAIAFALCATGALLAGAWHVGLAAARAVEDLNLARVQDVLSLRGQDWAHPRADGAILRVEGNAPDEASRLAAIDAARQSIVLGQVEDRVVLTPDVVSPPETRLELLLNDGKVSLVGLVPGSSLESLAQGLRQAGYAAPAGDMLETVAHPAPEGWATALVFAMMALEDVSRAKIRVEAGRVEVAAVAEDEVARTELAARLRSRLPEGVALTLDLSAPRPVIAPYTFAFRLTPTGEGHLAACSAETADDAARILEAARRAGLTEAVECQLGLGAPSPAWAEAALDGIEAVAELGAGSFSLSDMSALLVGGPDISSEALAQAGAALDAALSPVFSLATRGSATAEAEPGEEQPYVPEFRATIEADGSVALLGPVPDGATEAAIEGFTHALFGHEKTKRTTMLDPNLPEGWATRVLSALEALRLLTEGSILVTPDGIAVEGQSLHEEAGQDIAGLFANRAESIAINVTFDAEAAAALAEAMRPADERCAEEVTTLLAEETILFEVNSATIDPESEDVIGAIAGALRECPAARFEVSGHTDSQGRASLNQELSQKRAAAVVAALSERGVLAELQAVGFGAERPVADNATAEGRALNRRIEFALLSGEAGTDDEGEDAGTEAEASGLGSPEDAAAEGEEQASANGEAEDGSN